MNTAFMLYEILKDLINDGKSCEVFTGCDRYLVENYRNTCTNVNSVYYDKELEVVVLDK